MQFIFKTILIKLVTKIKMHFRHIKQNFRWILSVTIMRTKNGQKYIVYN